VTFKKGELPPSPNTFQPGQTGNPNGRPKGPTFRGVFNKIMRGEITTEQAGQKVKMSKQEAMCAKLVEDAMFDSDPNVRRQALITIMNRVDGMPVSKTPSPTPTVTMRPSISTSTRTRSVWKNCEP
jgi:hypothetical protein